MALRTSCVHERKVETADGIHDRGPMIMPRGSWCFACDGQGKNGSWKPARKLNVHDVDRLINDVDPKQWNGTKWVRSRYAIEGEFLPPQEVAYKVSMKINCVVSEDDLEAARAISEDIQKKIEESFDREYFYGPGTVDEVQPGQVIDLKSFKFADVFMDGYHVGSYEGPFVFTEKPTIRPRYADWSDCPYESLRRDCISVDYATAREPVMTFGVRRPGDFMSWSACAEVARSLKVLESFEQAEAWSTVRFKPMWKAMDPIKDTKGASEAVNFRAHEADRTAKGNLSPFSQTIISITNSTFNTQPYAVLVGSDLEDYNRLKRLRQLNAELEAAKTERKRCEKNATESNFQANKARELSHRISEERFGILSKLGVKGDSF